MSCNIRNVRLSTTKNINQPYHMFCVDKSITIKEISIEITMYCTENDILQKFDFKVEYTIIIINKAE